jgi:hypothetical protein
LSFDSKAKLEEVSLGLALLGSAQQQWIYWQVIHNEALGLMARGKL